MFLTENKKINFTESKTIFDIFIFFYLIISIFNFDNFFQRDFISFILLFYLLFFYFSNLDKFLKIKELYYVIFFIFYLIILQFIQYENKTNLNKTFFNFEFNKIIFNLLLFSFIVLYRKNWMNFFEKFLLVICFFLIIIFIQNIVILEKLIITSDIFFNYNDFNYNWDSKNFIGIILNVLIIFLNLNLTKKKTFYFLFFILSVSIFFTYSRAGYYLYLINLLYLLIFFENKKFKISILCVIFVLSSVFWSNTARDFYITKKLNSHPGYLTKPEDQKPKYFFDKNWLSKESKSVRISYFFIIFENLKKNFLTGNGLGSFKEENKIFYDKPKERSEIKRYPDPHSTWLLLLYETGILGLLMYLLVIFKNKFGILSQKKLKQKFNFFYFFVIIFISSLFINIMYAPIIWFLYSMKLDFNNENKTN